MVNPLEVLISTFVVDGGTWNVFGHPPGGSLNLSFDQSSSNPYHRSTHCGGVKKMLFCCLLFCFAFLLDHHHHDSWTVMMHD